MTDKKLRRDAQELFQRIVDMWIIAIGRVYDQSSWLYRSLPRSTSTVSSEAASEADSAELKTAGASGSSEDRALEPEESLNYEVLRLMAKTLIKHLHQLLVDDSERVVYIVTNLQYYVLAPGLKNCGSVHPRHLALLFELYGHLSDEVPTFKLWRKDIWDFFMDSRMFAFDMEIIHRSRRLVENVVTAEPSERMEDLFGRISSYPTPNIFLSKEQEALNRATMLKRLAFVIFVCRPDLMLRFIPVFQEKLVESLKMKSDRVTVEVFLCMRVLVFRLPQKSLQSFWPSILAELIRLFTDALSSDASLHPDPAVFLAACKFLDLGFTLALDEFRLSQWMFVTDSAHSQANSLRSANGQAGSSAFFDKLSQSLSPKQRAADQSSSSSDAEPAGDKKRGFCPIPSDVGLRRPLLTL